MIQAGVDISTISNTMKNFIDEANKQLNNDWQGELNFNVFTEENHTLSLHNCIEYATYKNLLNKKKPSYFFCAETYPKDNGFNGSGFKLYISIK